TGVDNMGFMVTMKGELNGKKFTLVSEAPMTMMGTTFLDRVTWDLETMKFTDEHASPGGNDWKVMRKTRSRSRRERWRRSSPVSRDRAVCGRDRSGRRGTASSSFPRRPAAAGRTRR